MDQRLAQRSIVDEVLVTNSWIKEELMKSFAFPPEEKICLIHNAKPVVEHNKEAIGNPVRFVMTSRLANGKGHHTFIKAFKMLKESGCDNFQCDFYGIGPMEERIRDENIQAGLDKQRGFQDVASSVN